LENLVIISLVRYQPNDQVKSQKLCISVLLLSQNLAGHFSIQLEIHFQYLFIPTPISPTLYFSRLLVYFSNNFLSSAVNSSGSCPQKEAAKTENKPGEDLQGRDGKK